MLLGVLQGNVTRDAEVRDVSGDKVCSFGVASNDKVKGEEVVTFVDVSIWGKRGEALCQYLTKGKNVTITGPLSRREHEGKTYLQIRADQVAFGGGGKASGGSNGDSGGGSGGGEDDSIPF